jgi:hypothetical protein
VLSPPEKDISIIEIKQNVPAAVAAATTADAAAIAAVAVAAIDVLKWV